VTNKQEERRRDARRVQALKRLGTATPVCSKADCDEARPAALCLTESGEVVCYECLKGGEVVEPHHVPPQGHAEDFTLPLRANDHRCVSDDQYLWPPKTLRNPDASPLLKAAATIRSWVDLLRQLIEDKLAAIPAFLERLDAWLTETHGPTWWTHLGEVA
jgi:hypothetical protein